MLDKPTFPASSIFSDFEMAFQTKVSDLFWNKLIIHDIIHPSSKVFYEDIMNKFFNDTNFSVNSAAMIIKQFQSEMFPPVLSENLSIELLTATGQFYVIDVDDKYIIRFPKEASLKNGKSQSLEDLKAESEITKSISPYINKTKISIVSVVNSQFPFAIHKKIKGNRLTSKDFSELTDEQRNLYVRDLAAFLAELHAVPLDKVTLPDKKEFNFENITEIQRTLSKYGIYLHQNTNRSQDLVCCHNDIHAGNIGVDLSKQHILQGVFDFGICGVAKRSSDFYKIFDFDKNLCREVIEQYNKVSTQQVNLHDVEDQYLSWCAMNIQMAEGKYPQIVSIMETKLQDFKQYQSQSDRFSVMRSKLSSSTVPFKKSITELRGLTPLVKAPYKPQTTTINPNTLKLALKDKTVKNCP